MHIIVTTLFTNIVSKIIILKLKYNKICFTWLLRDYLKKIHNYGVFLIFIFIMIEELQNASWKGIPKSFRPICWKLLSVKFLYNIFIYIYINNKYLFLSYYPTKKIIFFLILIKIVLFLLIIFFFLTNL